MIILGISDSHEAHACIVKDGKLLAVMAEERLSRLKADMGYPRRSIDAVLKMTAVQSADIDFVAFSGVAGNHFQRLYKMNALFSVQDWIRQCKEYWGPVLIKKKSLTLLYDFNLFKHIRGNELVKDPYYPFVERTMGRPQSEWTAIANAVRVEAVGKHLGISADNVHFYRHEDCHKAYGYFSSPFSGERALVFTVEGGGDDSSATVSTMEPDGSIVEHWKSNAVQLGRLYRYVTLILGMKPAQHEYKVMGLAPYSTEYHGKRSLEFFRTINIVEGTEIKNIQRIPDLYFSVRDALEGERFDGIAWGLQTYLEEVLTQWIANNCEAHGIDKVIFSGGVAQNIKACKKIMELPQVRRFWTGPIAGDGSIGIGAAWLAHRDAQTSSPIVGLPTVYLGTSSTTGEIDVAIERHGLRSKFRTVADPTHAQVAEWLDRGYVVARFSGRMEFGQRALGNRSIIADPRRWKSVEKINQKIKYRDFWMPFTPSMLYEEVERLLENPKAVYSPFMTMAFDLKPAYEDVIPAVVHPSDKTVRPQMLKREDNPGYYDLIVAFKKRTGLGVVLNTSFNLHGDAIAESPDDAMHTFLKSDLDVLLFDHVALLRVDP